MAISEGTPVANERAAGTSIGRRILTRSVALGVIPLVLLGLIVFVGLNDLNNTAGTRADESRQVLSDESVVVASEEQAVSVSREINVVLNERIRDVQSWARLSGVVTAATDGGALARSEGLVGRPIDDVEAEFATTKVLSPNPELSALLISELEANPDFGEIFLTDVNGFNVAFTNETSDFVQSDESWWNDAMETGLSVSDVAFDESAQLFSVDISVRIDSASGRPVGVMKTSLGIGFVQTIADERSSDDVEYAIALSDGRLIAETETNHSAERMMSFTSSPGIKAAIEQDFTATRSDSLIDSDFVYGFATTEDPERFADLGVGEFSGFNWRIVSTQSADTAFAPLRGLEGLKTDISDAGRNLSIIIIVALLAGITLAYFMARATARGIVRPILQLTDAAATAAETGLPSAVDEINAEGADLDSIRPPSVTISTDDELETLASAFNSVQATAVRLAAEQASSRRNTSEMFVNLGRRNQSLLKRQLRFIDSLEESEENPDTLESLFKLDHLATRMRRNAESLLVLAGDRSPRRWAAPVPIRTAAESALAEVEDYERVDMSGIDDGEMTGNVVADVAHILAEVIENGLNFSPPTSDVIVSGQFEGESFVLTVADQGLGMKQEEMDEANQRLSTVTELTEVPSQYLGLFVVARLAERHGIAVTLNATPSNGTGVRIVLPASVLHTEEVENSLPEAVTLDEDPEIASAEAEVFELLAKAEVALAKVNQIRSDRSAEEVAEEEAANESRRSGRPSALPSRRADDHPVTKNDVPDSDIESPALAVEAEPVDVGGMQFTRRSKRGEPSESVDNNRRASDPVEAETKADAPDISEFGFSRRESKRSTEETSAQTADISHAAEPSEREQVEVVAQKSRSQWSSFQRGKQEAETTAGDES